MSKLNDFEMWPKDRLKPFLKERGLPVTGNVHELRALAFASAVMNVPLVKTGEELDKQRAVDYKSLRMLSNGNILPDPLWDLQTGWIPEERGAHMWPPTMYSDMADYLVDRNERSLQKRLMGDYKDSKAFSYFDSGFIGNVMYHPIDENSSVCFLKSQSARSQRRNDEDHKVWIAIEKATGTILTAYCSCFAGLGSTCNHIAGVLFKLDYAWQQGQTNKACTSLPALWTQPAMKTKGRDLVSEMEWRKPTWVKSKNASAPINTKTRSEFNPLPTVPTPTLEDLMSALYVCNKRSCVMQYALHSTSTRPSYEPDHDVNVESEVEVCTSVGIPPPPHYSILSRLMVVCQLLLMIK